MTNKSRDYKRGYEFAHEEDNSAKAILMPEGAESNREFMEGYFAYYSKPGRIIRKLISQVFLGVLIGALIGGTIYGILILISEHVK